jgi:PAS domain S-box-containing protein
MANKDLSFGIKAIRDHVKSLSEQSDETAFNAKAALDESLEELRTSLEELQVAEEELRTQNEQLLEARNEIEKERLRYHHLFEFAPDGYIVTSVNGIILEANQAAANMLSMIQNFLPGQPLASFIEEENQSEFRNKISQLNQNSITSHKEIEVRMLARNGRMLDIAMSVAVVRGENQRPESFRWLLRDITQRKRV